VAYTFGRTAERLMGMAWEAAPLGVNAVRDYVRLCCGFEGLEVLVLEVDQPRRNGVITVRLTHRDDDKPEQPHQVTIFETYNPNLRYGEWELNLNFIRDRQASTPPHLRGHDCTDDPGLYEFGLKHVRDVTGYDGLTYGDIWVADASRPEGGRTMSFGCLTRAGEIAVAKYMKVKGLESPGVTG
jgi:hypothetical protein